MTTSRWRLWAHFCRLWARSRRRVLLPMIGGLWLPAETGASFESRLKEPGRQLRANDYVGFVPGAPDLLLGRFKDIGRLVQMLLRSLFKGSVLTHRIHHRVLSSPSPTLPGTLLCGKGGFRMWAYHNEREQVVWIRLPPPDSPSLGEAVRVGPGETLVLNAA